MEDQPYSLQEFLGDGTFSTHIVLRGSYLPNTVRCEADNFNRSQSIRKAAEPT